MTEEAGSNKPAVAGPPDFNQLELEVLKYWQQNGIFKKSLEQTLGRPPYIFYDGPPFATGLPHYGHILGSAAKDFYGRYQTMKGRHVRRRWGWDCHGLPIENIVEQNLKISGKKHIEEVGVERFNKICRENVLKFADEWGKMVERMGRWVEFDNSYKTMDSSYMESVWWGIRQFWDQGLIYEDRKVLLYCPRCETPVSNFEVAMDNSYRDVTEESVFVKFKLLPRQRIVNDLTNDKTYLLAWTTTPWTLPGNTAVNVGTGINYAMVEQNGERYVLAKDRLETLEGSFEIVAEFAARSLEGLQYEPLYPGVIPNQDGRAHRIYAADFVTTADGTGLVHNAAMYGEEDYELAKAKQLPRHDMLDHKGQYLKPAPENLRGMFFKDADPVILRELKERNLVYKTLTHTHSYPHCHRCGTPLYYSALPAWFIAISKIKPRLKDMNQREISWHPEHLKSGRFEKSLDSAPDWNISRNRYWATPLPFWRCGNRQCSHVVCVGSVAELREKSKNFADVYPEAELRIQQAKAAGNGDAFVLRDEDLDLHRPFIDRVTLSCPRCGGEMNRVSEVVDCWVESGSMPFAELHYPFENRELFENRFPADFVAEYIGQVRAWFYVMLAVSGTLFDKAPFRHVVTTGNILAEDGGKMSKSKNNYPDPWVLVERHGIDALRFYLLTSPVMEADDINFSEKSVSEISRKVNLPLFNVWTFYRTYRPAAAVNLDEPASRHVLDRWIAARLAEAEAQATDFLDGYDTVRAGRLLAELVADLSTWYLRRSRERIKSGGPEAEAALSTLGRSLVRISRLLAPFMPFLSEHLYRDLTNRESVHLDGWPGKAAEGPDHAILQDMVLLRELVEQGLSARKEKNLKVRQPLSELEYHLRGQRPPLADDLESVLAEELNVKRVSGRGDFVSKAGWAYRESPRFKMALNIELTEQLKLEGAARELERQIQELRKKSGLKVGDLVDVYYNTQDERLEQALLSLLDRKKTFINQVKKSLEVEVDFESQEEVDGVGVWLGLVKV